MNIVQVTYSWCLLQDRKSRGVCTRRKACGIAIIWTLNKLKLLLFSMGSFLSFNHASEKFRYFIIDVIHGVCWEKCPDLYPPPATHHERTYEHLTLSSAVERFPTTAMTANTVYSEELHAWTSGRDKSRHGRWQITQLMYIWNWFLETRGRIQVIGVTHMNWNICNSKMIKSDGFSRRCTTFIFSENKPDNTDLA